MNYISCNVACLRHTSIRSVKRRSRKATKPPTLIFLSLQFRQPNLDLVLCGILRSRVSLVKTMLVRFICEGKRLYRPGGHVRRILIHADFLSETTGDYKRGMGKTIEPDTKNYRI